MPHSGLNRGPRKRGVHKSTGGISNSIPSPVDPVDAARCLTSNTVALSPLGDSSTAVHYTSRTCFPTDQKQRIARDRADQINLEKTGVLNWLTAAENESERIRTIPTETASPVSSSSAAPLAPSVPTITPTPSILAP